MANTGSAPSTHPDTSVWAQAAEEFARWRSGEPDALDELVRTLSPVLWQVVRAYGLERDPAEDVVQSTWLALVRRHDSIIEPQAVASWLTTTARREAWRVSNTASKSTPVDDEVLDRRTPATVSTETEVVARDEHDRLWTCVAQLSSRCQRLLRVVAFDDRPDYARLAAELKMPVGSIGPTRGRCLSKLRATLSQHNEGDPR